MKNFNEQAFLSDVAGINWEQMLNETDDINVLVNHWTNIFSLIIDKYAPLCDMRVLGLIDRDLRDLLRTRDKLKNLLSRVSLH